MKNLAAAILLSLVCRTRRGGVIVCEHALTAVQTRFHVSVLRRWFDFTSLGGLPNRLACPGRRPFCLLTFDDGKRSNFSETAPELERLGVPAVFYVTTGFLTAGSCLWFDRRAQLVRWLGGCPAGLELSSLKRLPFDQLTERLDRACAEFNFKADDRSDDVRPMSWDEAGQLHRRGFAIGAHGSTHAILTRVPRERAFAEIEESLAAVTRQVGQPCDSFAFPNGNYTPELAQHTFRCGATSVMTTDPHWTGGTTPLWRLPRIQLFGGASQARIELKLALGAFKGALPNPDGSDEEPGHRRGLAGWARLAGRSTLNPGRRPCAG